MTAMSGLVLSEHKSLPKISVVTHSILPLAKVRPIDMRAERSRHCPHRVHKRVYFSSENPIVYSIFDPNYQTINDLFGVVWG